MVLLESFENRSESRITAPKSAIEEAAITSWPKVEEICPESFSTGTSTPSEVALSSTARNTGCFTTPAPFSSDADRQRDAERHHEAEQRDAEDPAAQPAELDLEPGEEQQHRQADGRHDDHRVIHVHPAEHGRPEHDAEHQLEDDRRQAQRGHEAERERGREAGGGDDQQVGEVELHLVTLRPAPSLPRRRSSSPRARARPPRTP